jgi:hypothetical protein
MDKGFRYAILTTIVLLLASCSSTKYVPDGSYLLDEVRIHTDNKEVKPSNLSMYIRQNPNAKWFSLIKTQLYVYNWSGRDSTRWINRTLRKLGDAPVIYSEEETNRTREEITKAVQNMGYMGALVEPIRQVKKKKMRLVYKVTTGKPYKVRTLKYDIRDSKIKEYMRQDSAVTLLSEGMYFDVNVLDAERQRITNKLLQNGYYKFNKEYISYTADTVRNSYLVDLTLHLAPYKQHNEDTPQNHQQYTINKVSFITDYNVLQASALNSIEVNDSLHYKGFPIYYKDKLYLRPKVLTNNLRIIPGTLYNEQNVQRTYSNYGRLQALKYTNIRFFEVQQSDSAKLNAYVMLTRGKHQSVSFEVEGTNSAGDLGAAASVAFQHRNMFKGSETFMFKLRGAYEAVSGLQSSLNQDYIELGAEATINFPQFMFPFVSSDFKRRIRATTEFGLQYNYQMRPEFTRIVASAGWSYKWGVQQQRSQHRIDLLDINYLYMPSIDQRFKEDYLKKHDVEIKLNQRVMGYENYQLALNDGTASNTKKNVFWVAGVKANSLQGLPAYGPGNRLKVDTYNRLSQYPNIFAIGNTALMISEEYPKGHPQVVQPAIQQARNLIRNLQRAEAGLPLQPFIYQNKGSMETIGRNHAVVELKKLRFGSFPVWAVWLFIHLMSIVGVKNRLSIFVDWMWSYFTYDLSLRIIIKPLKRQ